MEGRRMILVDIENVVGGGVVKTEDAAAAFALIDPTIGSMDCDQFIVGASHVSAIASGCARPSARLVVRSGKDGADIALLEVLKDEHVEERFDEVVLVSGDGIFADEVARLGSCGVKVTVVAADGKLSRQLRMAASEVFIWRIDEGKLGDAA